MSLVSRLTSTFNQIAADIKALQAGAGGGTAINDASTTSTTTTWSAQKSTAAIAQVKTDILGGASAAYDTFLELQNIIVADESTAAALATAVNNRVRFDASQTLTTPQMLQACTNLGIGDPDTDFLAAYTAAKA